LSSLRGHEEKGYRFTLVLNRKITGEESESLQKAGCGDATITTVAQPLDVVSFATQLDIDTEADQAWLRATTVRCGTERLGWLRDEPRFPWPG
jgi:hypothetical protein